MKGLSFFLIAAILVPVAVFLLPGETYAGLPVSSDKFIWVAKVGAPFSSSERGKLAQYNIVVIENYHNGGAVEAVMEEARQLTTLNPNVKVFPYVSLTKIRNAARASLVQYGFQDAWYLRDNQGNKIPAHGYGGNLGKIVGYYIDNSNPDFQQWLVNTIALWMEQAPFAGVAFDEVRDLLDSPQEYDILSTLPASKIEAWNNGQKNIIAMAHNRLSGRLIIFNRHDAATRLNYAGIANFALNEDFCFDRRQQQLYSKEILLDQLSQQVNLAKNNLGMLQKINLLHPITGQQPNSDEQKNIGRYCYGLFLLGWSPGLDYFKLGFNYDQSSGEIDLNALEANLPLGDPVGEYFLQGNDVLRRRFVNGYVYINMEPNNRVIKVPETLIFANGGIPGPVYESGQTILLPPHEAYFFLKSFTPAMILGDITEQGDTNGDEVNIFDYNLLVSDFGKTGSPGFVPADIDKNGRVDIFDYNIVVGNFGK